MAGVLTPREIRTLANRLVTAIHPDQVILFGSYAKGRATARSDVDLLVVVPDHLAGCHRPADLAPYLAGSVIRVDLHIVTASEMEVFSQEPYHFLHSISRSGKVLYSAAGVSSAGSRVGSG